MKKLLFVSTAPTRINRIKEQIEMIIELMSKGMGGVVFMKWSRLLWLDFHFCCISFIIKANTNQDLTDCSVLRCQTMYAIWIAEQIKNTDIDKFFPKHCQKVVPRASSGS